MSDLPKHSVFTPPSDRSKYDEWLTGLEHHVVEMVRKLLVDVSTRAVRAYASSLTAAAGDDSAFDPIRTEWEAFARDELGDTIGSIHAAGAFTAYIDSPLTSASSGSFQTRWADVANQAAVDFQTSATNRLVGVGDQVWSTVRDTTVKALADGVDNEALKAQIEKVTGFSEFRADTIGRTETLAAYNAGDYQGAKALGDFGPVEKYWIAALDNRTREWHAEADGQTVAFDDDFDIGGEAMAYPLADGASAENVVNCVLGDTQVSWAGNVNHATRRVYCGPAVKIVTAAGGNLTVTPNHPVLTPIGYVPASALRPGDQVVCTGPDTPQVGDRPACIEQVYRTACESGVTVRSVGSRVDFHGDGTDDEVQVVRADSDLAQRSRQEHRQPILVSLGGRHRDGACGSGSAEVASASEAWFDSAGSVGGMSESASVGDTGSTHSLSHRLSTVADRQPHLGEPQHDHVARDVEAARHRLHAFSLGMTLTEVVEVENVTLHDTPVFNIETSEGWYIGNTIAVHNCRCVMGTLYPGDTRPDGTTVPLAESGDTADGGDALDSGDGTDGSFTPPADTAALQDAHEVKMPDNADPGKPIGNLLNLEAPRMTAAADKWGVSKAEVSAYMPDGRTVAAAIKAESALTATERFEWMDSFEGTRLQHPKFSTGGEYDWFKGLDSKERARLGAWFDESSSNAIDVVYEQAIRAGAIAADSSIDDFAAQWVDATRQIDASKSLRAGRWPDSPRFGGLDPAVLAPQTAEQGINIAQIIGKDEWDRAGYLADRATSQASEDAYRALGADRTVGDPPWRMSFDSWRTEVGNIEYDIENGVATAADQARLGTLVPFDLDHGQDYEALYAEVVETAKIAKVDVASWATIPWA